MEGKLDGQDVILGSVYAPNSGQVEFSNCLFPRLWEISAENMVLGGDFNIILDTDLNRSTPPLAGVQ